MGYQIFKDTAGLITYLPEVVNSMEEVEALLMKYRNKEKEAGNTVSIIENYSFISYDGNTGGKTFYQMGRK